MRRADEHDITAKLTGPYSPTTTGKRWHRTLPRELLDAAGPRLAPRHPVPAKSRQTDKQETENST